MNELSSVVGPCSTAGLCRDRDLFSFVVLAALYIHRGSAESKDGEERLAAALRRIEEHLGTLPDDAPTEKSQSWKLPDTPLRLSG